MRCLRCWLSWQDYIKLELAVMEVSAAELQELAERMLALSRRVNKFTQAPKQSKSKPAEAKPLVENEQTASILQPRNINRPRTADPEFSANRSEHKSNSILRPRSSRSKSRGSKRSRSSRKNDIENGQSTSTRSTPSKAPTRTTTTSLNLNLNKKPNKRSTVTENASSENAPLEINASRHTNSNSRQADQTNSTTSVRSSGSSATGSRPTILYPSSTSETPSNILYPSAPSEENVIYASARRPNTATTRTSGGANRSSRRGRPTSSRSRSRSSSTSATPATTASAAAALQSMRRSVNFARPSSRSINSQPVLSDEYLNNLVQQHAPNVSRTINGFIHPNAPRFLSLDQWNTVLHRSGPATRSTLHAFLDNVLQQDRQNGLSKKEINSLASHQATADYEDACCICIDCIRTGSVAMVLPCTHVFHRACITQWLERQTTCPLCKYQLKS